VFLQSDPRLHPSAVFAASAHVCPEQGYKQTVFPVSSPGKKNSLSFGSKRGPSFQICRSKISRIHEMDEQAFDDSRNVQRRRNALRKGRNSISMPDYMMMGMTGEDEFAINQRTQNIINMRTKNSVDLPPPRRFLSQSSASCLLTRAQSVDCQMSLLQDRARTDLSLEVWTLNYDTM
jgi:hypothetical protein